MIALFVLVLLDYVALKLLVRDQCFLSTLYPILVRLQLAQGLFFQFALLLLLEILHNLVIPLTVEDHLLTINLILQCLMSLLGLALVDSFLSFKCLFFDYQILEGWFSALF